MTCWHVTAVVYQSSLMILLLIYYCLLKNWTVKLMIVGLYTQWQHVIHWEKDIALSGTAGTCQQIKHFDVWNTMRDRNVDVWWTSRDIHVDVWKPYTSRYRHVDDQNRHVALRNSCDPICLWHLLSLQCCTLSVPIINAGLLNAKHILPGQTGVIRVQNYQNLISELGFSESSELTRKGPISWQQFLYGKWCSITQY